jgi:dipeptidyl aminopeptidase/acylaminoacyl peptidase
LHTLRIAAADGSGETRNIPCPRAYCEPSDWSPDGRQLLVTTYERDNLDVWLVTLDEPAVSRPLLNADYIESDARFAPNGRWVAYVTEESGRPEIALRSLSANAQRSVVTSEGGAQPVWRRDGRELYYVDLKGNFYAVLVHWSSDGSPKLDPPQKLDIPSASFGHWGTQYDVSPDGKVFYFIRDNADPPPTEAQIVLGWRARLTSAREAQ